MKILITGANGFIGRHVVYEALDAGHKVVAVSRQPPLTNLASLDIDNPHLQFEQCDLAYPEKLLDILADCDAVIHLAASVSGSNQYQQTLDTTQNLLTAMDTCDVKRLVLISSISIINYIDPDPQSTIDENTPLCKNDHAMGEYARMKRDQEKLCRQWRTVQKQLVVIRPGLVYDDNNLSDVHAGFFKKGIGIAATHHGLVPLSEVKKTAEYIISATTKTQISNETFHLVDIPSLSQQEYLELLKHKGQIRFYLPLNWNNYSFLGHLVRKVLQLAKKATSTPDSFRENSIAARQKPFKFSAAKAGILLKD
jgi:nucleoside-diphosphate-sugar epimerase